MDLGTHQVVPRTTLTDGVFITESGVSTALYALDIYIKHCVLFLKCLSGLWSSIQFWTVSKNECEKPLIPVSCLYA